MIVTLPIEIEKIVAEKISSGGYQSADEVISKSVCLLEAKEKGTEALRRGIMRGFEDIQEGRFSTISTDEELEAFSNDLIRQAKEKPDASKNQSANNQNLDFRRRRPQRYLGLCRPIRRKFSRKTHQGNQQKFILLRDNPLVGRE